MSKKNWIEENPPLTEFEISEAIRFADMEDRPDCHGVIVPNYRILNMLHNKPALNTIRLLRQQLAKRTGK